MADAIGVYSSSSLVYTDPGQLAALVVTASAGAPLVTVYDNTAGSGTKLFEAYVSYLAPVIIFFSDRFGPRFATGLYISLAANLTAVVWSRNL